VVRAVTATHFPSRDSSAPNSFFAMNTIARGEPAAVVPMLKKLGYEGLGGGAGDDAVPRALDERR
jgi:hypothetical protein